MTYTILGRDPKTGELGIGIATYSLAVGATCPQILPGIAVATSQASTNPAIAEEMMELVEDGVSPADAFMQSLANDEHPEFRQLALLTPTNKAIVHSGINIKPESGHHSGNDCAAVGNFLANSEVLPAMTAAFESQSGDATLADRILAALEHGKAAGGQSSVDGSHLTERSACIVVGAPGERFPIDVRIDASDDAVTELRIAFEKYRTMHPYYLERAGDPTHLPPQDQWARQNTDSDMS